MILLSGRHVKKFRILRFGELRKNDKKRSILKTPSYCPWTRLGPLLLSTWNWSERIAFQICALCLRHAAQKDVTVETTFLTWSTNGTCLKSNVVDAQIRAPPKNSVADLEQIRPGKKLIEWKLCDTTHDEVQMKTFEKSRRWHKNFPFPTTQAGHQTDIWAAAKKLESTSPKKSISCGSEWTCDWPLRSTSDTGWPVHDSLLNKAHMLLFGGSFQQGEKGDRVSCTAWRCAKQNIKLKWFLLLLINISLSCHKSHSHGPLSACR